VALHHSSISDYQSPRFNSSLSHYHPHSLSLPPSPSLSLSLPNTTSAPLPPSPPLPSGWSESNEADSRTGIHTPYIRTDRQSRRRYVCTSLLRTFGTWFFSIIQLMALLKATFTTRSIHSSGAASNILIMRTHSLTCPAPYPSSPPILPLPLSFLSPFPFLSFPFPTRLCFLILICLNPTSSFPSSQLPPSSPSFRLSSPSPSQMTSRHFYWPA
jgi:hypothetical protein